ncbi:MAG: XRE family transcriptional regulator [Clostridia bacterium]|nr:XRE family transcriptional regulator [Clostridia bacterium]
MNLSIFAESLSELITETKLTPSDFAEKVGCGKGTISRYLSGNKMPSVSLLVCMADFFQCSTDYLLGLETERYPRVFKTPIPFQERLPMLCKQLNTTKAEIKRKCDFAESAIYFWQSGERKPSVESIYRIAVAYGCSIDFILGRSDF